ncbi:MAG: hypothetical protein JWR42_2373, partial [Marmoricola sp.]|nr:hypothetical protein [Marmoricola sp.]
MVVGTDSPPGCGATLAALLPGLDGDLTAVPWDDTVQHRIVPGAVVLDWVVVGPGRRVTLVAFALAVFTSAVTWLVTRRAGSRDPRTAARCGPASGQVDLGDHPV